MSMASTQAATVPVLQGLLEQLRGDAALSQEVRRETRFVEDLGLASLELIGLVYLCEQTFEVSLVSQSGLLASLRNIGQTIDAITALQESGVINEPGMDEGASAAASA